MKNLLTLTVMAFLLLASTGCKKIIDKQKENFVLSVMSDGQWKVTRFIEAKDTITSQFSDYSFQFNRDYTVDAIINGAIENKGTWEGNPETMDITADFSNPAEAIGKINGTWRIYQHSLSYVMASQTESGIEKYLRLDKK
ncbi:hypothetical protein LZZ85_08760 [Terrimonas sp. NA20]|uniref:DUF5004 domain-containing protein n=1 Tax=Terrimonas ginsenosidimutans TaxID=2908004 RepID=A0ABS9KQ24_9BACT|nr:hypothetical protein [Terrimonas ginsenosidimutans]MCG2614370.1 hypothetical protein [Terrimonas ginsenosidimutans]